MPHQCFVGKLSRLLTARARRARVVSKQMCELKPECCMIQYEGGQVGSSRVHIWRRQGEDLSDEPMCSADSGAVELIRRGPGERVGPLGPTAMALCVCVLFFEQGCRVRRVSCKRRGIQV